MDQPVGKRIDAGIKRGPRKQVNRQPKAAQSGQFLPNVPPEERERIVQASYLRLVAGESCEAIAQSYSIPGRTLRHWLIDDPKADEARRIMIHGELARTLEEMREARFADSPLPLACAREEFRAWSWIADRRLPKLWGQTQKVEMTDNSIPSSTSLLADALQLLALVRDQRKEEEKVIESVPVPLLPDA